MQIVAEGRNDDALKISTDGATWSPIEFWYRRAASVGGARRR